MGYGMLIFRLNVVNGKVCVTILFLFFVYIVSAMVQFSLLYSYNENTCSRWLDVFLYYFFARKYGLIFILIYALVCFLKWSCDIRVMLLLAQMGYGVVGVIAHCPLYHLKIILSHECT